MRVVITGASGNVGSALTRRLREAGEYDVIAVARRIPHHAATSSSRWVSIDLSSRDCEHELQRVVRGADAVVHLAWAFQPSHQVRYLEVVGVGGTQRVLDGCTAMGVGQVVHMSSVGAYSPKRGAGPVTEDYPVEGVPRSSYSRHTAAAERLLDSFEQSSHGTAVARLRPRALMLAAWHARLQPVSPGWLDLGYAAPALDSSRAEHELGWSSSIDAMGVLRETLDGMGHASAGFTAVLRQRTVMSELFELLSRGPVSHRRQS